ncbi:MAG: DUF4358 domain-containing protein [Lachnospiraceae bacterium]|nr:DUF4358 domain-containing protein [Lachnospiraceae bacterium]
MKRSTGKVIRRIIAAAGIAVMLASMAGCGGSGANVNAQELADELKSGIAYKDDLSPIDLDTAAMFYSFGDTDITEAVFYESSGATAEEIAVIKCGSEADAGKAEDVLRTRVSEQIESYKDYVPAELEKLNAAVVYRKGSCAVLSVSDEPDKAREIITSHLK